jgi:TatD DNase family protein
MIGPEADRLMNDAITWIDSHAHLTMFDADEVDEILGRAAGRGVVGVLVPATSPDDLDVAVRLASEHPESVVAAAGIHPHDARTLDDGVKRRIERALHLPGVVAVGEIGLDYHYMQSPREDQIAALGWQLDLAVETGLPVVLHNRESWQDLEPALASRCPGLRGVAHSFAEGPAEALRVVELGLVVGISGMVTFARADNIRRMAAPLTPNRVMVETDSPFLAPVPHRGRRNEPAFVVEVGRRLAALWSIDEDEVAAASTAAFRELFRLPGS